MSDSIKVEELSNNQYLINDKHIIFAPNLVTAIQRFRDKSIKTYNPSQEPASLPDTSEEHY